MAYPTPPPPRQIEPIRVRQPGRRTLTVACGATFVACAVLGALFARDLYAVHGPDANPVLDAALLVSGSLLALLLFVRPRTD